MATDIDWAARPLKDFEDQPLERLADDFDLILIDHPFTQAAADSGLIAAVDDWADAAYLAGGGRAGGRVFSGTIATMGDVIVRPRRSGHRRFQELAGGGSMEEDASEGSRPWRSRTSSPRRGTP